MNDDDVPSLNLNPADNSSVSVGHDIVGRDSNSIQGKQVIVQGNYIEEHRASAPTSNPNPTEGKFELFLRLGKQRGCTVQILITLAVFFAFTITFADWSTSMLFPAAIGTTTRVSQLTPTMAATLFLATRIQPPASPKSTLLPTLPLTILETLSPTNAHGTSTRAPTSTFLPTQSTPNSEAPILTTDPPRIYDVGCSAPLQFRWAWDRMLAPDEAFIIATGVKRGATPVPLPTSLTSGIIQRDNFLDVPSGKRDDEGYCNRRYFPTKLSPGGQVFIILVQVVKVRDGRVVGHISPISNPIEIWFSN